MYCRHVVSLGLLLWSPLLARADSFAEGDACVVTVKEASLQRGDELLVRIPNGTRLKVERVREGWVRTRFTSEGKTHEGWIEEGFIAAAVQVDPAKAVKCPDADEKLCRLVLEQNLKDSIEKSNSLNLDVAKLSAGMKDDIASLKLLGETAPEEMRPLVKDIAVEVEWFVKLLRTIREHPDVVGLPRDSSTIFSLEPGAFTGKPKLSVESREILPDESLNGLRGKLFHGYDEMRAQMIRVANRAKKRSGPLVNRGQALTIDFLECYEFQSKRFLEGGNRDPFDNPDRIRLTNASGVTLTNCIVLVKVVGEKDTRFNVHFVPKWVAGQMRIAEYYSGIPIGEHFVLRTTCSIVQRVEVSIWSEQLSQEEIGYRYDEREKDFAFREYVNRVKVVADCTRYKGIFENGYRVKVSFRDIPYVPLATVTVRVKRDGVWTERVEKIQKWRAAKIEEIDFSDLNKTDVEPTEYEVTLKAKHEGWSHSRTSTWKKE